MKKKAFIGLGDISSMIEDHRVGFEKNNFKTRTGLLEYPAAIQTSNNIDFIVQRMRDRVGYFKPGRISVKFKPWWNKFSLDYQFKKTMRECDVFFFIWETFYPDVSDLRILKENGKKVVNLFCGDDIRWMPAKKQEFAEEGLLYIEPQDYDFSLKYMNARLAYLRNAEKYSDMIYSAPNISQTILRPYHKGWIPMDTADYAHNPKQRTVPKVVFAPTSIYKGTVYIEKVLNQLLEEGVRFEYIRLQHKPRKEALEIYLDADIIVDQVCSPGGGKLVLEGLSMGKVVLNIMKYDTYDQKIPSDCPIIDVDHLTLYDNLKDIIYDVKKRTELAQQGRSYVEKYHSPEMLVKKTLDHLYGTKVMEPDFYPTFFRDRFVPESEESISIYNKWTDYVKDCDWYKKNIKPGERAGLKF